MDNNFSKEYVVDSPETKKEVELEKTIEKDDFFKQVESDANLKGKPIRILIKAKISHE